MNAANKKCVETHADASAVMLPMLQRPNAMRMYVYGISRNEQERRMHVRNTRASNNFIPLNLNYRSTLSYFAYLMKCPGLTFHRAQIFMGKVLVFYLLDAQNLFVADFIFFTLLNGPNSWTDIDHAEKTSRKNSKFCVMVE